MPKPIGSKKRIAVWYKSDGHCWYCGARLAPDTFSVDHYVDLNNGGTNDIENLVPACLGCNRSKGSRGVEYLRKRIPFRLAGIPNFTQEQREWLSKNTNFDLKKYEGYEFYFEKEGLKR